MTEFSMHARRRILLVISSLVLMAMALLGRLFDLQIVQHQRLVASAEEEIWTKITLHPRRGHIFDRNGRPLALNEKGYVLWVDGERFAGNDEAEALVAEMCKRQSSVVIGQIRAGETEGLGFFLCSRWAEPAVADRLYKLTESDDLKGIVLEVEPRRFYPYGSLLAPVLGYLQDTGKLSAREETAYEAHGGVEQFHDAQLRGVDGWVSMQRDPEDFMIPIGQREEHPPRDGAQVTLTLDLNIDYMAQQLLISAVQKADARRGDIVVLDPHSGAILAMVSWPSFDPNDIVACANDPSCGEYMHINPPIGRLYEPGSTMKIVTMAIALEEHIVTPESTFECTGLAEVDGVGFHNWNGAWHGHETMAEVMLHSCNVGAVTVSQLIPSDTYYRYLKDLGFGQQTGVDLANEVAGEFRSPKDANWTRVDQAANAFGQAIGITPLQLTSAVAAVANGGELWRPYIVQAIERDGVVTPTLPALRGQIFHKETTSQVTQMLVAIADFKGKNGGPLIPGYHVALKTGTAQIPVPGGGYEPNRTIASAIGYAPVEDPRFVILVRVEGNSVIYGEQVAVPTLADLARFVLAYMHIPPTAENTSGGP